MKQVVREGSESLPGFEFYSGIRSVHMAVNNEVFGFDGNWK